MDRCRNVCLTLNNWTQSEYDELLNYDEFKYIILGKEIGKDKQTPHLQGYGEFKKRISLTKLKKLNKRIHWEPRRGTQKQAIEYCKKENNFEEKGIKNNQGQRKDLKKCINIVKKKNFRALFKNEPPNFQQIKVCEKYLTYCENKRDWKPEVIWIHGESGLGKTRLAHLLASEGKIAPADVYIKDNTQWWDGYDKHETIIIDDFRASQMKFTYLLKILDRYEMRVEVKGGYRQLLAKKIIITSIEKPQNAYTITKQQDEPIKQLIRRIDKIVDIKEAGETFEEINFSNWTMDTSRGNTSPTLVTIPSNDIISSNQITNGTITLSTESRNKHLNRLSSRRRRSRNITLNRDNL